APVAVGNTAASQASRRGEVEAACAGDSIRSSCRARNACRRFLFPRPRLLHKWLDSRCFHRTIWPLPGFRLKLVRRLGVPKQPPGDDNVGRMQFLLGLRRRGIGDADVLRAMDEVPREHFVEGAFVDNAYADQALPIACGQTISQPYVVAFMTEHLDVQPHHRVLEVGTGSGYQAAVLSRLAREVVSVERYRTLAETAPARLRTPA